MAVAPPQNIYCPQLQKGTAAAVPFRVAERLPGSALGELVRGRALVRIARRMGRIAQAGMLPRRVGVAGRLVAGAADDRQLTSVEFTHHLLLCRAPGNSRAPGAILIAGRRATAQSHLSSIGTR